MAPATEPYQTTDPESVTAFVKGAATLKRDDADSPLPALLERSDGATLLYEGCYNSVYGRPGLGKSWLAILVAKSVVDRGGRALWCDYDDTPRTMSRRAPAVGFNEAFEEHRFAYYHGESLATLYRKRESRLRGGAVGWLSGGECPGVVIIDSVTQSGAPVDSVIHEWDRTIIKPWRDAGLSILVLDHIPKRAKDRPVGAIGSQQKLASISGSAISVSGKPWSKQSDGRLVLNVDKDRHGDVPAPAGQVCAVALGEHRDVGGVPTFGIRLIPPTEKDIRAGEDLADKMLKALASAGDEGIRGQVALRSAVGGRGLTADETARELVDAGMVATVQKERHTVYRITETGVEGLAE